MRQVRGLTACSSGGYMAHHVLHHAGRRLQIIKQRDHEP